MKTLGKYEILEKIGQGPRGVVYKAWDPIFGRLAALKAITMGLPENAELLQRWWDEYLVPAGSLQHPNVVIVYDVTKDANALLIGTEFLEGEDLHALIGRRAQLSIGQKMDYAVQVCRALEYAHARGVFHRGIKGSNVIVSSDAKVKVVDFSVGLWPGLTGLLVENRLPYMSPELLQGGNGTNPASEIWAVGILLYELLTYRRPFTNENLSSLIMSIQTQSPPPVSEAGEGNLVELDPVIDKMLQKDVKERYQSMQQVVIDLESIRTRLQFHS